MQTKMAMGHLYSARTRYRYLYRTSTKTKKNKESTNRKKILALLVYSLKTGPKSLGWVNRHNKFSLNFFRRLAGLNIDGAAVQLRTDETATFSPSQRLPLTLLHMVH